MEKCPPKIGQSLVGISGKRIAVADSGSYENL
jgi:hypothetical protein